MQFQMPEFSSISSNAWQWQWCFWWCTDCAMAAVFLAVHRPHNDTSIFLLSVQHWLTRRDMEIDGGCWTAPSDPFCRSFRSRLGLGDTQWALGWWQTKWPLSVVEANGKWKLQLMKIGIQNELNSEWWNSKKIHCCVTHHKKNVLVLDENRFCQMVITSTTSSKHFHRLIN